MDGSMLGLREIESRLPPGFRFHPSDQELVCYYLRAKVANQHSSPELIVSSPPPTAATTMVEVDLHACEPWELPEAAKLSDDEWYFFSFRDRKYATGSRKNRATKIGYWKATGKDKVIHEPGMEEGTMVIGMRKTLVFYLGRAPNGRKSSWVMHEFRLNMPGSPPKEDWVLCRVFHKGKGEAEQGSCCNDAITIGCRRPCSPQAVLRSPPQHTAAADDRLQRRRQLSPISSPFIIGDQLDAAHAHQLVRQDAMSLPDSAMLLRAAGGFEFSELLARGGDGVAGEMGMGMGYGEDCGVRDVAMEWLQGGACDDDGVLYF
ncbi:hypothetical protein ACP70R_016912 [Stipagrostis hirtigluma subsp. patula]